MTKALGKKVEATHLPFTKFHFEDDQKLIALDAADAHWICHLTDYTCNKEKRSENRDPEDEGYDSTLVLSMEGPADNYYAVSTIVWSPDSKYIGVYRIRPGYRHIVDYVESSPACRIV